jgi:photosystem II stability/assembly factor-like uncharacterized protein
MRNLLCLAALVLTTTFSSAQWTKLDSGTDASLRGVSAVDANVCWASGSKGTVLRTTDGGKHWNKLPIPNADKLDFRDVEAFDANTAIIMSAGPAEQGAGKIFKTTDGGAHWKEVLTVDREGIFFDSMAFWDKKHGIVFSDPVDGKFVLWTTKDSGDSWQELHPESMPAALPNEGAFAASGTAIAVAGKNNVWFGTGGASVARVFHSVDGGKHWTVAEVPIAAGTSSAGVFGLAFKDPKHGVAVGGDYRKPKERMVTIATTNDGGTTWKARHDSAPLGGVVFAGEFYSIGSADLVTLEEGENLFFMDSPISGYALSAVAQGRNIRIFVVGPNGMTQFVDTKIVDRFNY